MRVVGRRDELAVAEQLLAGGRDGFVALVFDGAAGIGKTAVWSAAAAAAAAAGARVVAARPSESDAAIPFSALADVVAQLPAAVLAPLPRRQRIAIRGAIGEREGAPPDPLALALGVGTALRSAAGESPVVLAVDDVQWVDGASARALGFALRRLHDGRVSLLTTQRTGVAGELLTHLERERIVRVDVGALAMEPLAEVVRERLGFALPYPQARALADASGGNPLFALELARAARRDGLALVADAPPPFAHSVGALLDERVASLRPKLADALLTLALLSQPRVDDVDEALLAEAESLELIVVEGGRLRFAHPLLRSSVHERARPAARRRRHLELAERAADPVERALHLARGTLVPDAELAASLETAADRAARGGGYDTAATLLEHAARLSPDDGERVRRILFAADRAQSAGDLPRSETLLARVESEVEESPHTAYALLLRARRREFGPGTVELVREARRQASDDAALLARIEVELANSLYASSFESARTAVQEALAAAERSGAPALIASATAELAFANMATGRPVDVAALERALAIEERLNEQGEEVEGSPRLARGQILTYAGELGRARVLLERAVALEREHRRPPLTLFHLAVVEWRAGDLPRARACLDELAEASAALQMWEANTHFMRAFVEATAGETDLAAEEIDAAERWYRETGNDLQRVGCRTVLGFLALTLDRHEDAARESLEGIDLMRRLGWRETGVHAIHQHAIEALVALGRLDEAAAVTDELERLSRPIGRIVGLAGARRGRAAIAAATGALDEAAELCRESLALQEELPEPFELGRTRLLLGSVLRRARHAADARAELAQAAAEFEAAGARLWLEKASAEQRRIGGRRAPQTRLTPTEERIAALVARGRTNHEVAAALFVSPKTVEWNLSKIYRKLRVSSRTELALKLSGRG